MVSLVGCVLPRTDRARDGAARRTRWPPRATWAGCRTTPPPRWTPGWTRSPSGSRPGGCWRLARRTEGEGRTVSAHTISAEQGYLREVGNLVFHVSLIGLLVGFAAGKLYGYEGQVIVLAGGGQFCNTGILGYDSFHPGLRVDGTELAPFCVRVDDFTADYLPNGQANSYRAALGYQTAEDLAGDDGDTADWRPYPLAVNNPLRMDGNRVYLLGHGYAPRFTVTFPDGQQRTAEIQWSPVDPTTLLSEGATKFARPGVTDEQQRRTSQLAITGLLAPTSSGGDVVTSVFPALRDPEVAIDVLRGDLGLDDGRGQSIFGVDQAKVDSGELVRVARANLVPGQSLTPGRRHHGALRRRREWVYLQVSHDPGQGAVLVFAVLLLIGLGLSLTIRRRRFWARLTPVDGRRAYPGGARWAGPHRPGRLRRGVRPAGRRAAERRCSRPGTRQRRTAR